MKIPLQELIDIMVEKSKDGYISNKWLTFCIVEAEKLLEKEKKQIIDFGATCQMINDASFYGSVSFFTTSEKYYYETYNNKTDDKN